MKTIIAAVDFSDACSAVVDAAVDMAKSHGADLHLIHVVEAQPTYAAYGFTPDEFPALHQVQVESMTRAEIKLRDLADTVHLVGTTTKLLHGQPLHTILEYADELNADLLVLGSHGHGVLGSLFLGSVAEGCVRKAKIPSLIIPVRKD
ncbi:hypothetical protein NT6N_23530 [Oceaniferula spumae]|uniref:Universal stress protein n=1 Tax=Oceaniferula spumae TaxID=2979115 RepID=A0AAT9FMW3_9BACT